MIHIAGGTYAEFCIEPAWEQLFGSGVRAAAALSELSDAVSLVTYVGDEFRAMLESMAATFNFESRAKSIPTTIRFHYYHGLSEPHIYPALHMISRGAPQTVEAPNILRFGFLEGDAVVHGEYVVYDPQDAYNPRSFSDNGSTAEKLAIVANLSEAIKLADSLYAGAEIESLGKAVLEIQAAEVAVIKRGTFGATVITATETRNLPAYRTSRVWPLGSGDVFAATFAFHWANQKLDAFEAARLASLSTAYYCENKSLPIPVDLARQFFPMPVTSGPNSFPSAPMQLYLAGPFFTMAQRWMVEQSRTYLADQGFKVFSPFHDVGPGPAPKVVPADIKALQESAIVFAILDGLDSGTLFEIGYARAMNKPVIAFVQNETDDELKMLVGTECEIVEDFVSSIYKTAWAAMAL